MRLTRFSKRLLVAYVFDWIIIVVLLLISYGLNFLTPRYHPFSLVDLTISYPYSDEIVKTSYLVIASVVGPAIIILLVSLALIPSPLGHRNTSWGSLVRRKLWEVNTGWLGLALSEATALLITQGLKNIIGKPRPDLLARCNPSLDNIAAHTVGGYASAFNREWVLVDQTICQQPDQSFLNDGFRSFPSGHSSTSWSGLLYLTLYLCSKFAVVFPYLPQESVTPEQNSRTKTLNGTANHQRPPKSRTSSFTSGKGLASQDIDKGRSSAAAPPLWTILLAYVPIGIALYIASSRYFQYYHHGFDVITGSAIGIVTSCLAFRLYHMPLSRGSGWSWGPRSPDRAFGVGVGSHGYVDESRRLDGAGFEDVELGTLGDSTHERELAASVT